VLDIANGLHSTATRALHTRRPLPPAAAQGATTIDVGMCIDLNFEGMHGFAWLWHVEVARATAAWPGSTAARELRVPVSMT
jgi:hypothetical protein